MDDRGWTWPAWKFGLKRDDLFTTLHDQYNTFPSSIQDPEAFHHDVWEISNTASTQDEFHAMLADRKELRLRELNETLESASFEIIANPKLIGTEQWQFAIQLFRTRSLDSLVRYFASYLPESHPWHHTHGDDDAQTSTTVSSVSDSLADSIDTIDSVSTADSGKPFFDDDDHDYLTHEPLTIHTTSLPASHLPPSPRSMTMCSNSSAVSPIDADPEDHVLGALTATRAVSYSDEEFDAAMDSGLPSQCDEDETSQDDDFDDTPFSSVSDIADIQHSHESRDLHAPAECVELTGAAMESVEDDSETPTPRSEYNMKSYPLQEEPSKTMLPAAKASQQSSSPLYTQVLNEYVKSRKNRREGSPTRSIRRTSPEIGRIQKPLPESTRIRPSVRRRNDC